MDEQPRPENLSHPFPQALLINVHSCLESNLHASLQDPRRMPENCTLATYKHRDSLVQIHLEKITWMTSQLPNSSRIRHQQIISNDRNWYQIHLLRSVQIDSVCKSVALVTATWPPVWTDSGLTRQIGASISLRKRMPELMQRLSKCWASWHLGNYLYCVNVNVYVTLCSLFCHDSHILVIFILFH